MAGSDDFDFSRRAILTGTAAAATLAATPLAAATAGKGEKAAPIVIEAQGSFAVGGTVITRPGKFDSVVRGAEGQTLHADHGYVFYQIPVNAKKLPLVFWHGIGQFSKTWETTPDGREGYQNIFLRRGHSGLISSGAPLTFELCRAQAGERVHERAHDLEGTEGGRHVADARDQRVSVPRPR